MIESERLMRLRAIARARTSGAEPAHDFLHVERVAATARKLAEAEHARADIAVAAALLHELFNYPKSHPDSAKSGEVCAEQAVEVLRAEGWPDDEVEAVAHCIRVHSFSRGLPPGTNEAAVLQDADRLDSIGAIGVARCFATTALMGRPFYAVEDPFCEAREPNDKEWAVDHFFRKLLKIEATLNTQAARTLAAERSRFMRAYLQQLSTEIG